MCFGSKIVDTTTKQQLPAWLEDEAKRITQMSAGITDKNAQYVPYGGERLAGLTTEQQLARQGAVQQSQAYRPDLQTSRAYTSMGASPISAQNISQYQNPYNQAVMQTTLDELERRQQISDQGMSDQAVKSGAYGGARYGVQQAESQRNLRDIQAKTAADIQSRGYQQALGAAQADKQRQGAAGQQYGNIAGQEMQLGGAGLSGLYQAGQLGQTQGQAGRDISYEDFQRQQQFPYAQAQYAAGLLGGMPSPMTTFFSDVKLKDNIKLVGKSPSDINIYSFNYKGSKDKYEGVLAQEVLWASTEHDGYLMVDYSKLDVDFRRLN